MTAAKPICPECGSGYKRSVGVPDAALCPNGHGPLKVPAKDFVRGPGRPRVKGGHTDRRDARVAWVASLPEATIDWTIKTRKPWWIIAGARDGFRFVFVRRISLERAKHLKLDHGEVFARAAGNRPALFRYRDPASA